jgi:dTDP-4-dehydrorhamnose reductase
MVERILVTGGTGKLGKELQRVFPGAAAPTRTDLDLREVSQVADFMRVFKPELILNAAALTGINQCEENRELAYATNVTGVENLVHAIWKNCPNAYLVHISTPCVFNGDRGTYSESDLPYPKNFYSLTKLLGEAVIRSSSLPRYLIVRTNFSARASWPYPKAFADRYGTYLFADDLAHALKRVVEEGREGVLHVCGAERLSMYELALITTPNVEPMYLREYRGPPLTVDMTLISERIDPFLLTR